MLTRSQCGALLPLSVAFWLTATFYIRAFPGALTGPAAGPLSFAAAVPVAWACVRLTRRCGRLSSAQLLPGVALVGTVALMMDGAALRWLPRVYGDDETTLRLAASWLLWGYGASLGATLLMSIRPHDLPGRALGQGGAST